MSAGVLLPPGYQLVALDSVDSTNEEAKRLAGQGAEDGTIVWALEQTAGRGRRGRSWVSPRGNLYASLLLCPECPAPQAAQLSFVAALGLHDAVAGVVPPMAELACKWPNDLLLNGRKVAGILLESRMSGERADDPVDWLIIGMGVNIATFPEASEFPATSLAAEGAPALEPGALLESYARHFLVWLDRWLNEGFEPIRTEWLAHARGRGEAVTVRLTGETLQGTFVDLDADGALVVETGDGRRRITAGDVFFGGR